MSPRGEPSHPPTALHPSLVGGSTGDATETHALAHAFQSSPRAPNRAWGFWGMTNTEHLATTPTLFLCLDASDIGGVYLRLRTEVKNALDPRVYNGHVHTWPLREGLGYEIYSTLLEVGREHRQFINAGYSTRWNGSAMVAEYTEDAIEHLRQIQEEVDTINGINGA